MKWRESGTEEEFKEEKSIDRKGYESSEIDWKESEDDRKSAKG